MVASSEQNRRLYEYRAITRYIPLMIIAVWVCAGIGLYVSVAVRSDYTPPLEKQLFFWAPWLLLTALGIWGQLSYNKRLKPIEVTAAGLWIGGEGRPGAQLVPWEAIERVRCLRSSASQDSIIPGKGGIFIWEKRRRMVVYEPIQGFDELWQELRDELERRGIVTDS